MILAEVILTQKGQVPKRALVKKPAVGIDWITLSKEEKELLQLSINDEKHNITGPVLISDKWYYRRPEFFIAMGESEEDSKDGGFIMFNKEALLNINMDLLRAGNLVNLEHKDDVAQGDVELVESWLIETEHDKAYDIGFTSDKCPIFCTIMQTQHINQETETGLQLWKDIKAKKYNGFSIQGHPSINILGSGVQMSEKIEMNEDEIVAMIVDVIKNNS